MATKPGLAFIISTDRRKADPDTRRLIRSHVMQGKNRIKPRKKPLGAPLKDVHIGGPLVLSEVARPLSIPRLLCSDLAAIRFADTVEPALVADVLSFSTIFSKAMFALDQCIIPQSTGLAKTWFVPMLSDPAYLHAICFTVQTYYDGLLARTRNADAQRRDWLYYAKAVRILQDRLMNEDDDMRLSDSTIMTIMALSGHAYMTGDYISANNHNSGLLKLVSIRGLWTFVNNTKLFIEIIRTDLVIATDAGTVPVLFASSDIPWPLTLLSRVVTSAGEQDCWNNSLGEVSDFPSTLDPQLDAIWAALSDFCVRVNTAVEGDGPKIAEEAFLHSMGSIMYRLLHCRFPQGSLDEGFRLGLLAFASPIFIHWNKSELLDRKFTLIFRKALIGLCMADYSHPPQSRLWLLMVGALSMSHEPDSVELLRPLLRMELKMHNILSWEHMRTLLSSFLWVGLVYDELGKSVLDMIMSH